MGCYYYSSLNGSLFSRKSLTLKGANPSTVARATGLVLQQPEKLDLKIYPSLAGAIPVLFPGNREDFETLVRALTKRNEPQPLPPSMGRAVSFKGKTR